MTHPLSREAILTVLTGLTVVGCQTKSEPAVGAEPTVAGEPPPAPASSGVVSGAREVQGSPSAEASAPVTSDAVIKTEFSRGVPKVQPAGSGDVTAVPVPSGSAKPAAGACAAGGCAAGMCGGSKK